MTLKALVFDAYGTLYDPHSVAQRCEQLWPGKGDRVAQLWRTKQLEYSWQRSLMGRYVPFSTVTLDALRYACEALDAPLGAAEESELMAQYRDLAPYPDVPPTLAAMGGYRKAILSNGSPDMLMPLVQASGLAAHFNAVLSVDELRMYKPAPEVYRLAVERLDVEAGSLGFVSSNGWDAAGAKSFGFRVFWINRAGAPIDALGFAPDQIIRSLGELPGVLTGAM